MRLWRISMFEYETGLQAPLLSDILPK